MFKTSILALNIISACAYVKPHTAVQREESIVVVNASASSGLPAFELQTNTVADLLSSRQYLFLFHISRASSAVIIVMLFA